MYIRKIFSSKNVNLLKQIDKPPALPQRLGMGRGLGLTGRISLAAHSPAVPGGQDHFPEGPGVSNPATGRLLLGPEDLQSEPGPAPIPGRFQTCGSEA